MPTFDERLAEWRRKAEAVRLQPRGGSAGDALRASGARRASCSPERVLAIIEVVEKARDMAKIKDRWIGFEVHAPRKSLRDALDALAKALDAEVR